MLRTRSECLRSAARHARSRTMSERRRWTDRQLAWTVRADRRGGPSRLSAARRRERSGRQPPRTRLSAGMRAARPSPAPPSPRRPERPALADTPASSLAAVAGSLAERPQLRPRTPTGADLVAARVMAHSLKPPATLAIGAIAAMAVIGMAALSAVLAVVAARDTARAAASKRPRAPTPHGPSPPATCSLYRQAARGSGVPWPVLAAIGSIESDHGRSRAPGVRSGSTATAAAPARCSSTRATGHPRRGSATGSTPTTTAPQTSMTPRTRSRRPPPTCPSSRAAPTATSSQAILGYNHSPAYVRDVLARARAYARASDEQLATTIGEPTNAIGCADSDLAGRPARRTCAPPSASPRRAPSARCPRGHGPAPASRA